MFEVGKKYIVSMIEPGTSEGPEGFSVTDHYNMEVKEVALPMVKFDQFGKEVIVNVTAPTFSEAKRQND